MPPGEIGPSSGDAHPNPGTEHRIEGTVPTLLARLENLNYKVTDHIYSFSDAAPAVKKLAEAKIGEATARIKWAARQLADAEGRVATIQDRFQYHSQQKMVEFYRGVVNEEDTIHINQTIRARAIGERDQFDFKTAKNAVEKELENLRSAVASLKPALDDIVVKPDAATKAQLNQREQNSHASIQALLDEVQTLGERLGPPPASFAIEGLRLGEIGHERYYPGEVYKTIKDTAALYRLWREEPGNPITQQRFDLLRHALDNPAIGGDTASIKINVLGSGVDEYLSETLRRQGEDISGLEVDRALELWDQIDFALHAFDEQISNPPVTFRDWRSNWSYHPPETL